MVGYLRYEVVLSRARHVVHVAPASVRERSDASAHHVGVYIHGIDGVGHAYAVVPPHNLPDVSGVALGAVVHEYLVQVGSHPARDEVVLHYRLTQEIVSVLRTVTPERGGRSHLVDSPVHGFRHGGAQRTGHVAYAQAYHSHLRV